MHTQVNGKFYLAQKMISQLYSDEHLRDLFF